MRREPGASLCPLWVQTVLVPGPGSEAPSPSHSFLTAPDAPGAGGLALLGAEDSVCVGGVLSSALPVPARASHEDRAWRPQGPSPAPLTRTPQFGSPGGGGGQTWLHPEWGAHRPPRCAFCVWVALTAGRASSPRGKGDTSQGDTPAIGAGGARGSRGQCGQAAGPGEAGTGLSQQEGQGPRTALARRSSRAPGRRDRNSCWARALQDQGPATSGWRCHFQSACNPLRSRGHTCP